MDPEFTIDPEFQALIPPLRPEERQQLEASLQADGCRDPLVVWAGPKILIDGHTRYEICTQHDIPYRTVTVELPDREAAADWIDANQLGRRNLNPDQYALLRGRRYNRTKRGHGGDRRSNRQFDGLNGDSTALRLAEQHGVSERTVERDGEFAAAVEVVKAVDPEIEAKVVAGKAPPKGAIVEAAKVVKKAGKQLKEADRAPLLGTRTDQEAAEICEKAEEKAKAILDGELGTVAQAKREVRRAEKRADLIKKAEAAAAATDPSTPTWQVTEGDCVEVLGGLKPGSARLVFADPPYNIGVDYGDHDDDDRDPDDFRRWCETWMRACARVLADDGSMWVLIHDEWADVCGCLLRDLGLHRRSWIIWYEGFGVNCGNQFNRCKRHLFHMVKDPKNLVFNADAVTRPGDRQAKYNDQRADPGGKLWDDVWMIPHLTGTCAERIPDFPTQLPLALLTPIIGCASEPGDLVLDPFSGSGTTGAAAIPLGRRFLGVELSPTFAGLSRQRLTTAASPESRAAG